MPRASESCPKAAVSLSEMAKACQLSRSRFYELITEGIMPAPMYDVITRRPLYPQELQRECLHVRASNIGISGRYILFYQRRQQVLAVAGAGSSRSRRAPQAASSAPCDELVETLNALGLTGVSEQQVQAAIRACYPNGVNGADESEVIRAVFRHLRRSDAAS